eukprot:173414-Heterocapsa_arctica.AAC.1
MPCRPTSPYWQPSKSHCVPRLSVRCCTASTFQPIARRGHSKATLTGTPARRMSCSARVR